MAPIALLAALALADLPVPVRTVGVAGAEAAALPAVPDHAPVRLGLSLRVRDPASLDRLLADLQNPSAPGYHQWLTPAEFGARFGLPAEAYDRFVRWLSGHGFAVTPYPNRLFVEAAGNVADARALLGVQVRFVEEGGEAFHTYSGTARAPDELAPDVVLVAGLDTRVRVRPQVFISGLGSVIGPSDLRTMYDMNPLMAPGTPVGNVTTVVIGLANPSTSTIDYYLQNVSFATAPFVNLDGQTGTAGEETLDVEMQSVGAQHAAAIDFYEASGSDFDTTGFCHVSNMLPDVSIVSMSYVADESELLVDGGAQEASASETCVQTGLAAGQTWFMASGDNGSEVKYPASEPEMVAVGGTQIDAGVTFDRQGNLVGYAGEAAWPQSGGGQSVLFPKPSWQVGVGPFASDGVRDVPDLSLLSIEILSAGYTSSGPFLNVSGAGTSYSAPLAAGAFALLSGYLGCRLGDIHPALYQLGVAEAPGGAAPFHDITFGSNGKYSAVAGYDLVTGWGTLDMAALAAAWPSVSPCGWPLPDGGVLAGTTGSSTSSAGTSSGGSSTAGGSTTGSGTTGSGAGGTSAASSSGGGSSSGGTTGRNGTSSGAGGNGTSGGSSNGSGTAGGGSSAGTTGPASAGASTGESSPDAGSQVLSATGGCGCGSGAGPWSSDALLLAAVAIAWRRRRAQGS